MSTSRLFDEVCLEVILVTRGRAVTCISWRVLSHFYVPVLVVAHSHVIDTTPVDATSNSDIHYSGELSEEDAVKAALMMTP